MVQVALSILAMELKQLHDATHSGSASSLAERQKLTEWSFQHELAEWLKM